MNLVQIEKHLKTSIVDPFILNACVSEQHKFIIIVTLESNTIELSRLENTKQSKDIFMVTTQFKNVTK